VATDPNVLQSSSKAHASPVDPFYLQTLKRHSTGDARGLKRIGPQIDGWTKEWPPGTMPSICGGFVSCLSLFTIGWPMDLPLH